METNQILAPELELQRIHDDHPNLVSTGCSKDFCQAGRLIHDDEPRVGKNRALHLVEQEAVDFLQTLHFEGFFEDDLAFQHRLHEIRQEIRDGAIKIDVQEEGFNNANRCVTIGGNWTKTSSELEFGIRRAWRNSRKCIMRSHCEDLKFCDLREVTSSVQMVAELLQRVSEAFNGGNIIPTAFVFPPRRIGCRGPMFWNHQILQFAGYENADGSILGDPNSVRLTNEILELGWVPSVSRSPWDLLPLVAMAEGYRPAFAEISPYLRTLVDIRHPQYMDQFSKLDLKWVSFPALTRLGFDIGGVQYTAAPFIGSYPFRFMDAEIGVRNLADSFRYNRLPDIISALDLTKGKLGHGYDTFDDLPEYEKLSLLSRAQAELNYAVNWSFQKARISMVDSLTASMKWCKFDDEFKEKHGYRLPSDAYWLAPPQGSIIPLWHRGGAPNYQPKPMIARHVQDPIKAWGREKHLWSIATECLATLVEVQVGHVGPPRRESAMTLVGSDVNGLDSPENSGPVLDMSFRNTPHDDNKTVAIYFCSAGTIAEKLANKLHKWMIHFVDNLTHVSCNAGVEPLNSLKVSDLTPDRILLLVVSSTGHGDIPANGLAFEEMCHNVQAQNISASTEGFKFAVFGNRDSRYSSTYNEAAYIINGLMKQVGGLPLTSGIWDGDTAAETLPLRALHSWWEELKPIISFRAPSPLNDDEPTQDAIQQYEDHQESLLSTLKDATLVIQAPKTGPECARSLLLSLDIQSETYEEMSCIQVLPCNSRTKIGRALQALRVEGSDQMNLILDGEDPTFSTFLTSLVDLELPFLHLEWLRSIPLSGQRNLNAESLSHLSVAEVLERIVSSAFVQENSLDYCLQRDICLAIPLLNVKTYSIASSLSYSSIYKDPEASTGSELQIMVKIQENVRFSDTFLHDCAPPRFLKYRFIDSVVGLQLREHHLAPMVVVATGAGFGPVRCLLQRRIATARNATKAGYSAPLPNKGISLFLGLKECDIDLVKDVIEEVKSCGILDMTEIVLSNPAKRRVYDKLRDHSKHIRGKVVKKKGLVFVCAGSAAAEATKSMFEKVIGSSVEKMIGERYLEDVF